MKSFPIQFELLADNLFPKKDWSLYSNYVSQLKFRHSKRIKYCFWTACNCKMNTL